MMPKYIVVGNNGFFYVAELMEEFDCYGVCSKAFDNHFEALEVRNALT